MIQSTRADDMSIQEAIGVPADALPLDCIEFILLDCHRLKEPSGVSSDRPLESSLGRAESPSCLPYAGIRLLWSIGYRVLSVAGSSRIQILRWSESSPIHGLRS